MFDFVLIDATIEYNKVSISADPIPCENLIANDKIINNCLFVILFIKPKKQVHVPSINKLKINNFFLPNIFIKLGVKIVKIKFDMPYDENIIPTNDESTPRIFASIGYKGANKLYPN